MRASMNLAIPAEGQKAIVDAAGLGEPQKRLDCITDEVKDAKGLVALACQEDDVRMTGNTEVTAGADTFTTVSTMKDDEGRVSTVKNERQTRGRMP